MNEELVLGTSPEGKAFEALRAILYTFQHPVRIQYLSEKVRVPALVLGPYPYLSAKAPEEPAHYSMAVCFANDIFEHQGLAPMPLADSLVFELTVPGEIQTEKYDELAFLILQLNNFLPLGRYVLPPQGLVSLKYDLRINGREPNTQICKHIIDGLMLFYELTANKIEAVNAGILNVDEALEVISEEISNPTPEIDALLKSANEIVQEVEFDL